MAEAYFSGASASAISASGNSSASFASLPSRPCFAPPDKRKHKESQRCVTLLQRRNGVSSCNGCGNTRTRNFGKLANHRVGSGKMTIQNSQAAHLFAPLRTDSAPPCAKSPRARNAASCSDPYPSPVATKQATTTRISQKADSDIRRERITQRHRRRNISSRAPKRWRRASDGNRFAICVLFEMSCTKRLTNANVAEGSRPTARSRTSRRLI